MEKQWTVEKTEEFIRIDAYISKKMQDISRAMVRKANPSQWYNTKAII